MNFEDSFLGMCAELASLTAFMCAFAFIAAIVCGVF